METFADLISRSTFNDDIIKIQDFTKKGDYLDAYRYIIEIDEGGYFYQNQDSKRNLYTISHKHLLLRKLKDEISDKSNDIIKSLDKSLHEETIKDIQKSSLMSYAIKNGFSKEISTLSGKATKFAILGFIGVAFLIGTIINSAMRSSFIYLFSLGLIGWAIISVCKIKKVKLNLIKDATIWTGKYNDLYNLQLNILKNITFMPLFYGVNNVLTGEIKKRIQSSKIMTNDYYISVRDYNNAKMIIIQWSCKLIPPLAKYTVIVNSNFNRYFSAETTTSNQLIIREFTDQGGWNLPGIKNVSESDMSALIIELSYYLGLRKV